MSVFKELLLKVLNQVDDKFDDLKYRLDARLNRNQKVHLVLYRGFGNEKELYFKGRVLKDKGIALPSENETVLRNILSMYKRFETDEIPFAEIEVEFLGYTTKLKADKEGYFEVSLPTPDSIDHTRAWHCINLTLPEHKDASGNSVKGEANVMIPPRGCEFGVISDIDDTVLKSDAANLLKSARMMFLNNARTRLPFEGVSAFYRALQSGPDSTIFNPVFYVSSSPWNLYDLLIDFFSLNGIPKGPLMLREIGLTENHFIKSNHLDHKFSQIEKILNFYPLLPFVLIGDSGQKDPEIYAEVIKKYPNRIKVVYIRDVSSNERDEGVQMLAKETIKANVEMILVLDTEAASKHAEKIGLIEKEMIAEVKAQKAFDKSEPQGVEKTIDKIGEILEGSKKEG